METKASAVKPLAAIKVVGNDVFVPLYQGPLKSFKLPSNLERGRNLLFTVLGLQIVHDSVCLYHDYAPVKLYDERQDIKTRPIEIIYNFEAVRGHFTMKFVVDVFVKYDPKEHAILTEGHLRIVNKKEIEERLGLPGDSYFSITGWLQDTWTRMEIEEIRNTLNASDTWLHFSVK